MTRDHGLVYAAHGAPGDVLRLEALPDAPTGLRVDLLAAPILPMDRLQLRGLYPWPVALPAVAGAAGCGVIRDGARDGERVVLPIRAGTWRSGGWWPSEQLVTVPATLDPLQASLLVVNGLSAWDLLEGLPAGATVVQSPGGSVARFVDQLCTARGLRCVTWLRRPTPGWQEAVTTLPRMRADRALDGVGGDTTEALASRVVDDGVVWHYGAMSRQPPKIAVGDAIFRGVVLRGYWLRRVQRSADERAALLTTLASMGLHAPERGRWPLARWAEAFAAEGPGVVGLTI